MNDKNQTMLSKYIQKQTNIDLIHKYITSYTDSTNEYNQMLYEVIGRLIIQKQNGKITSKTIKSIIEDIYNQNLIWNCDIFQLYKERRYEEELFQTTPFTIDEGVLECFKCGSRRTFSFQRQTRSADEGATTFAQCVDCGDRWIHNN